MTDVFGALTASLRAAIQTLAPDFDADVQVQEVPADKPGDYGSPVAFTLARTLRRPPPQIAADIVARLQLPQ
ncbi:MAG TPA: arginine--tRNA ligase, partial [Trueperaceae bacterium]|nr:arginine--tRNA ligase [Trueperaceae bacterium]